MSAEPGRSDLAAEAERGDPRLREAHRRLRSSTGPVPAGLQPPGNPGAGQALPAAGRLRERGTGAASCEVSHSDARGVAGQPAPSLPKGADAEARRVDRLPRWSSRHAAPAASLALLGTGTVGAALLQRLARLAPLHDGVRRLRLAEVANSRLRASAPSGTGLDPHATLAALRAGDRAGPSMSPPAPEVSAADIDATIAALGPRGRRLVIDATGSEAVAARHAEWLAAGLDVVTASKLATGAALARWDGVRAAQARGGVRYGDSATVGAGLPILRTLRELQAGGDRIRAIAGSLSGSLAWLFARHDGRTPFSQLVAEARALGYTEPDPRQDLCGDDVRRKLLILARSAGDALEPREVEVESLADRSDAELAARLQPGRVLRYVARWRPGEARLALEALAADDPLAVGEGCDNRVAFWTDRYRRQPLVLQGPGAGAEVTAAALLDDVLAILRPAR